MKVPKARKLSSGKYFIQLRLGGESISVTDWDEKKCTREAMRVKAEYLAGKRMAPPAPEPEIPAAPTLKEVIDSYIDTREKVASPSTLRGYQTLRDNHFQAVMDTPVNEIPDSIWQSLINEEANQYSPKTLKNAWGLVKSAVEAATRKKMPEVTMPTPIPFDTPFLIPSEIDIFVDAAKDSPYAVPLFLGLMSCRISEIKAIDWKDIPPNPQFIRVRGAVVPDRQHRYAARRQNKNETSTRNIPVIIPEFTAALERDRKPSGPVLTCHETYLRKYLKQLCSSAGITVVTPHGLRHSFASLAYHLDLPKKITMEIGGWKNPATMEKIYTHIGQTDIARYQTKMADYYKDRETRKIENANKNANKNEQP